MTDAFSEYVTLLDEMEQIPVAARASASLSTEQRAATIARVVELVRDRVLPQSDREEASLEAVLGDDLAHADPRDPARIQEILYRLHAAIAGHFGDAGLIVATAGVEEQSRRHGSSAGSHAEQGGDHRQACRRR